MKTIRSNIANLAIDQSKCTRIHFEVPSGGQKQWSTNYSTFRDPLAVKNLYQHKASEVNWNTPPTEETPELYQGVI